MNPLEFIIFLNNKIWNFCTGIYIRNINDISTQHFFPKIKEDFGDQIKMLYHRVGTLQFEASLDKEIALSLLHGYLETADDGSTILLNAARCLWQLLHAVESTCDPLPNVLTSKHYQNSQAPVPGKCMPFYMELFVSSYRGLCRKSVD